jgi:hypothetical protein
MPWKLTGNLRGQKGEKGDAGPPGSLPIVREWQPNSVTYQGDVVTCGGSTWQAVRDTAHAPGHEDWSLIAQRGGDGKDAREMRVRGTYSEIENINDPGPYRALDVVALDGGSFIARKDDPGPCPGPGWQMIAARGPRGGSGPQGERGAQGPKGRDAASIVSFGFEGFSAVLRMSDGAVYTADATPLFLRYQEETQ